MSETDKKALKELGQDLHQWLVSLSPTEKVEHLKDIGILDRHGKLSSSYGGEGEPTRGGEHPPQTSATG